jgi:uncharacterized protein YdcH (DUF465 family)
MEMTTAWFNLVVSTLTIATLVGGMLGVFWRFVNKQTRAIVMENTVSQQTYREDYAAVWSEINQLKKFDSEFAVLNNKIENVDSKVDKLQECVETNAERQSTELTGGLERMRLTMVDFVRASTNK